MRAGEPDVAGRPCGDLPFADRTFDAVVTRFSFHHLEDPKKALDEMVRVCRPGGRVVVCDVYTTTADQAAEYDRLERLRDRRTSALCRGTS